MTGSGRCLAGLLASLLTGAVLAADALPRLADGHPDLNGTWDNGGGIAFLQPQKSADGSVCVRDCKGGPPRPAAGSQAPDRPRYRPEFEAKVKDLSARQVQMDPVLRCRPPGLPRIGPPDKIVHTPRELVFLYDDVSGPFFRIVPLDHQLRREDDSESYLGDAWGHWEGDTLVVQTRNLNDETWLTDNGAFHTAELTVTETLRRTGDLILYTATASDPKVLAEPWRMRPREMRLAALEMSEPAPCVEQDLEHMVDDTHHDNAR